MASSEHGELVATGLKWLKKQGFSVCGSELACHGIQEIPDIIGFRATCSAVIEVKISRADFRTDRLKPHRSVGGVGTYRFYLCPEGLITPSEVTAPWGLLNARTGDVSRVSGPAGNLWPPFGSGAATWQQFQHVSCFEQERAVLFSMARRLAKGASDASKKAGVLAP